MDTGMRIKYHRIKKKISSEELANGILSTRELKKIESGQKEPSLPELEAICKKLQIPLASKDNPVGKVLVKNFKSSLLHPQNKAKIMEQYADINNHPLLHADEDVELEYNIQQLRYFIITGDLDSAEEKIQEVERFKEFMNQEQFYLFHKYLGNYNYILADYNSALKTYLLAEKISPPSLSSSEIGDLYYSIGLTSTQCWEITLGIKYAEMALKLYQQEFIPKRIVECHLLIANNARRLGNFKIAKEHYKYALTIGKKIDHEILKFTTQYNYGYFYFQFQKFNLAIEHLEDALQFIPIEYTSDVLLNHCALIKCHIELNNVDAAKEMLVKGYEIIKEKKLDSNSPSNIQFKEVFHDFMCLYYYMYEDISLFEEYFLDNLLPILESHNKYFEIGFYFNLLGNSYFSMKKFKSSSIALHKANLAYKNLLKLNEE